MSTADILAQLPKLSPEELAQVQAKLDEIAGESWIDEGELTDADTALLDTALDDYRNNPALGSGWEEVRARIEARLLQ
jgi:putative addiction module component (TIGR02574 family)